MTLLTWLGKCCQMLVSFSALRLAVPLIQCVVQMTRTMASADHDYYRLTPIKWGFMEVRGINLATDPPQHVRDLIRRDVHRHRILIFRDQPEITGRRQVEISKWFWRPRLDFLPTPGLTRPRCVPRIKRWRCWMYRSGTHWMAYRWQLPTCAIRLFTLPYCVSTQTG